MHIESLTPARFHEAVALWPDAVLAFYNAIGYGRDDVFVMSKRLR